MVEFKLSDTEYYEELKDFFIENGLEVSADDPVPTDLVKCWKLNDESVNPPKLIGGVALAKRGGEFIIDGIAVDSGYRKMKLGKMLLDLAVNEAKKLSGDSVFLVARVPEFYKTQGFVTVPEEAAPAFFECLGCPQYGVSCHPEIMKLSI